MEEKDVELDDGEVSDQEQLVGAAEHENDSSALKKVLGFFGWKAPSSARIERGDPRELILPPLDVWVLSVDDGELERWTQEGGYRSPIYHPRDPKLIALYEGKLVSLTVDGEEVMVEQLAELGEHEEMMLLGLVDSKVGFLTERDVMTLNLDTGEVDALVRGLSEKDVEKLISSRGFCEGQIVSDRIHPQPWGWGVDTHAADLLLRPDDVKALAKNLTRELENRVNLEPAFSPDCQRIAFVSGDL